MVAFELPERLKAQGFELLFHLKDKKNLQVSATQVRDQWHLRFAPHIYNTKDEIRMAAEILKSL
jgi:selenocysteine lyase/cysteine desulfurase